MAEGQDIRLEFQNTPLIEALDSFREITGVDVVYSPQMAEYHRTSCIYAGRSVREALICIVTGLPFRTQEVSRSQFVLIPFSTSIDTSTERFVFSGFVVDAQSQETLIGAHLLLPGIGAGTVTNDAGFFAFPGLPGRAVEVQVSYLGFSPLDTTLVVDGEPVLFELRPSTSFLEDVVIEESSSQRADLVVTPGLLTLPPSELAALPGSLGGHDVLEALRWMPGIERAGEATGGLLVRGSGPDQNLYLIDGAPVYHPWHAFSLVSTFQTDTFKDISFYDFICIATDSSIDHTNRHNLKSILRHHTLPMSDNYHCVQYADYIGRFENYVNDLREILSYLSVENYTISKHNVTSKGNYTKYYDKKCYNLVTKHYEKDFNLFNYKF